jgi:hypothetical protein
MAQNRKAEKAMKVRRCPLFCHDKKCHVCGGTQYIHEDGTGGNPFDDSYYRDRERR